MSTSAPSLPIAVLATALAASLLGVRPLGAQQPEWHSFTKVQLETTFYSEGASFGDFDGDGFQDVVSGPHLFLGPDFETRLEYAPATPFDTAVYSNNFFAFSHDFDADGWADVLIVGFPGQDASWYRNPGGSSDAVRGAGHWQRHQVFAQVDNESPTFTDLTGDGLPELVCMTGGRLGWAGPDAADPTQPWAFHPVSVGEIGGRFTHGLGVGDIDGDGRSDLLMKQGWWQQPDALDGDPEWQFHAVTFAGRGGAQMYAYDIDGDGDSDVVTADNAHGYGLYWFEQKVEDGQRSFQRHRITGAVAADNPYEVVIGNLHAMDLIDMDGDGLLDLVTGARFWAHGGNDAADHEPALVYWFRLQRGSAGVEFVPMLIDDDSGVGTQVVAGDLDGDHLPEVIVGNKNGTFVHRHSAQPVPEWEYRRRLLDAVVAARQRAGGGNRSGGIVPTDEDKQSLNLGFEAGSLHGWTAEGSAFAQQPVEGDTVVLRRNPMRSRQNGDWWIGTYEIGDTDEPQGSLTSAPFEVTHPFASFLVGGGSHVDTCVEVLDAANGEVIFRKSGKNAETMTPAWVDLRTRVGQQIQIRLLDRQSGGWGHINFDDFRFHAESPEVVRSAEGDMPTAMVKGFLPQQAAERMSVPEGFTVDLIAGEPRLHQPIGFAIDGKGRLWVAEAYAYPVRRADDEARDHVLVFEDTNHDGNFDRRTVFLDNLNLVSGIEVGFGGVWIGAAPYFMFVPDRDDDLVPDSAPEILLDGWGYQDTHETLNAFNWGPDGWLYGCHGVFTHSRVGKPGTPDAERQPMNAGVWRYHPTRHEFEVFAWGTSNPWGVDFDDRGQTVITACVIPHLYHMIQGGRYLRQGGRHFNPYVFEDIGTVADHLHYLGATPHSGNGLSDSVGGGHAHCGAMIYLADQFPPEYRGRVFLFNVHGKRMNSEMLRAEGSGLVGSHAPDFLIANDRWFLGVALRSGPDGSIYLVDWYDKQACHRREPGIWDRSNGRMFRINYGAHQPVAVDLPSMSDAELAEMQLSDNDWFVRQARRILMERGGSDEARSVLHRILEEDVRTEKRLRALWALHGIGAVNETFGIHLLADRDPYLRAWAIQLMLEEREASPLLVQRLEQLARQDPSPVVRLYLASALQRLPIEDRFRVAEGLMMHGEDRDDQNLPLMLWYGFEPCVAADPQRALALMVSHNRLPRIEAFTYRRLASGDTVQLNALARAAAGAPMESAQGMVHEMSTVLASRPDTPMPASWPQVSRRFLNTAAAPASMLDQVTSLALAFGDANAGDALHALVADAGQPLERRLQALEGLARERKDKTRSLLVRLLDEEAMRSAALPMLAAYDNPAVARELLARIDGFSEQDRATAAAALATRPSHARALLQAVLAGRASASLLDSASLRQQLVGLGDSTVAELLTSAWGRSTALSATAEEQRERYLKLMTPDYLAQADLSNGRALYNRTCFACHKLFGTGLELGPDLTGSNRADLDYILGNILDPSAEVGRQYLVTAVTMQDGRVVSGMVMDENDRSITLANGELREVVAKSEIARDAKGEFRIFRSTMSLMPPGQLTALKDEEARDLIAYLASPAQVPLAASADNLGTFFNGTDLEGWIADPEVWSVDNGEIVGRSAEGLQANNFAVAGLQLRDFRLIVEVKLVDDSDNSGIQFRSERLPDGAVRGYQADIGAGWWGKLYEEHGRGLLEDQGAKMVRAGGWNTYEIVAVGDRVLTALNGRQCVDRTDPGAARAGILALQVHSGGPTEVRFRKLRLELDPEPVLRTVFSSGR